MLPTFGLGPWHISTYNLLRALAVCVGATVAFLRLRRLGLRPIYLVQAFLFVIPVGLVGSSLGRGIEDAYLHLFHAPCPAPLKSSSVVSGLIVGIAAAIVVCRVRRVSPWRALDLGGVAMPLAQAIGRLGCLAAGCCYGRLTDSFLGLYLPDHDGVWQVRYPTQLMAAAGDLLIFAVLLLVERHGGRLRPDGRLALLYLILFGAKRFALDFLRGDALPPVLGPLNSTQLVCAAGVLIAAGLLVWRQRRAPGVTQWRLPAGLPTGGLWL